MKLFRYKPDVNRFASIEVGGDAASEILTVVDQFNEGTPLAASWIPLGIEIDKSMGRLGDFPGLQGGIPVFSRKAWDVLRPLIGGDVEALPLTGSEGEFLAINILSIVDCLDHARSLLTRYPDGRVQKVSAYAFRPDCLEGRHMMKLWETRNRETIVSEEFRDLVSANALSGLRLDPMAEVI